MKRKIFPFLFNGDRKSKYVELKTERNNLKQMLTETKNKNDFFRQENNELRQKLKMAEHMLCKKDEKINEILKVLSKNSLN